METCVTLQAQPQAEGKPRGRHWFSAGPPDAASSEATSLHISSGWQGQEWEPAPPLVSLERVTPSKLPKGQAALHQHGHRE